ncbi:ficolin-1-like [Drosophila obscura]|uniref:ficolin-1-like n=1 Tax=Drosophila obscura TaxID=7282 RepID=UPI001BB256BE|nr:ficolin-1-like [Drosophila obscura]
MQSIGWISWLLVFFLFKSTGFAAEVSVVNGTDSSDIRGLAIQNPNSQCPIDTAINGIHNITVGNLEPFEVFCDAKIAGPGWTVIARRTNGELNFYRRWDEFRRGFGDIRGEFFIGLEKLHAITKSQTQELYVHLEDFEGNQRYTKYNEFHIESENDAFRMSKLGSSTGDAGDSMYKCRAQKFTAYDWDNDQWKKGNCAHDRMSAWWHNSCGDSALFGLYMRGNMPGMKWKGMMWETFRGDYSHRAMQMMVRPK